MINIQKAKELENLDSELNERKNRIKEKQKENFKNEVERLWKEFEAFFQEHQLTPSKDGYDYTKTSFRVSMGRLFFLFEITHHDGNYLSCCFTIKANDVKKEQEFLTIMPANSLNDLKQSDADKNINVEKLIPQVQELIKKADLNLQSLETPSFKLTRTVVNSHVDVGSLTEYLKTKFN